MRILGIVPARAGSKRIPGKNLRLLGGKTLVERAIELGLASASISTLCVTSDDREVLAIARRFPSVVSIERPSDLATDEAPAIGYVRHALAVAERYGDEYEAIAILQPSSPLTRPEDVEGTLEVLVRSGAESAVSVVKLGHSIHPAKLKVLSGDRLVPYLEAERGRMAEHELPEVYVRNCAVYSSLRRLIEAGRILGEDCRAFIMPAERSVDINNEIDLQFAQFLFERALSSKGRESEFGFVPETKGV